MKTSNERQMSNQGCISHLEQGSPICAWQDSAVARCAVTLIRPDIRCSDRCIVMIAEQRSYSEYTHCVLLQSTHQSIMADERPNAPTWGQQAAQVGSQMPH
jgi:hypothetical protein